MSSPFGDTFTRPSAVDGAVANLHKVTVPTEVSSTLQMKRSVPADAPDFVRINTIEASPNTPGKAYVSGIRYLVDNDRSPYIWKTENFGQSRVRCVVARNDELSRRSTRWIVAEVVQKGADSLLLLAH